MGYFSNGTEGDMYEERYCNRCVNYGEDGLSCAILQVHAIFNYDQNNKDKKEIRGLLDELIPRSKDDLGNEQCRMFHMKHHWEAGEIEPEHVVGCSNHGLKPDGICAGAGGACAGLPE